MRHKEGFIDVDEMLQEIGVKTTSIDSILNNSRINKINCDDFGLLFSFDYNNDTYFYKCNSFLLDSSVIPYNELIAFELAKDFGLLCVNYDLAMVCSNKGVLSKNFQRDNFKYVSGKSIILDYYDCEYQDINLYNSLESLWNAFDYRYKDYHNKSEIVDKLMKKLVDIYIFDIITCQCDRRSTNWQVMESENQIDIAPLFDNERILVRTEEQAYVSLTMHKGNSENLWDSLKAFLEVSDPEYKNIITEKLWIISNENLESVFKNIENRINYFIPVYIKEYYLTLFQKHKELLEKNLNLEENIRK